MVINLTQEFNYETDSLESLEKVLQTIIPLFFSKNSEYCCLHLKKDKPSSFDNGVDHRVYYDLQNRIVENPISSNSGKIENEYLLIEPHHTYAGVAIDRVSDIYRNLDEATAVATGKHRKLPLPTPKRKWITSLADYRGSCDTKDIKCKSHQDLLTKTLELIKKFDPKTFESECGDGYCSWFNHDDGSIGVGYRLQHRPQGGWNNLDISAIHIYYGK